MHDHNHNPNTADEARSAIETALPGAIVHVEGSGGHFRIRVVSPEFAGKRLLAKQRLVLGAIQPLLAGTSAPIHAVDELICLTPEEASAN
jgi:acid stress-induced BolA-like protein IbaG/YrbA